MTASNLASPPADTKRWRGRLLLVLLLGLGLPALVTLVRVFPPSEYSFYPPCIFNVLSGLHCPGCGATRCVSALLQFDVPQALAYNPLFVLALPLFLYAGWRSVYSMWTGQRLGPVRMPGWVAWWIVGIVFLYWILRNIPLYPFVLLAPHQL